MHSSITQRLPGAQRRVSLAGVALMFCVGIGCGSSQGTHPRDMPVAGHQTMAEAEERKASAIESCIAGSDAAKVGPCWSSRTRPTAESRREADEHRRLASEHREAAALLRAAEGQACQGISEQDRVQSPFAHHEDILSVQPLIVREPARAGRDGGAIIVFREVPGLTVEWLEKVIECHLNRNAALGYNVRELAYCPLSVNPLGFKKLKFAVRRSASGLAVTLRSEDEGVAREILRRAQSLVGPPKCLRTPMVTDV